MIQQLNQRNKFIFYILIGFILGCTFIGSLWYNQSNKVSVAVYACYYGQKWPWADRMAESLFRGSNPQDEFLTYNYKCIDTLQSNFSCDVGTEKTYVGRIITTKEQINKYLIPLNVNSHSVAAELNDSFSRLYPSYFYARKT